eukprot:scaffold434985_cov29-Prasinocladus_malaysianus.AAC.1
MLQQRPPRVINRGATSRIMVGTDNIEQSDFTRWNSAPGRILCRSAMLRPIWQGLMNAIAASQASHTRMACRSWPHE